MQTAKNMKQYHQQIKESLDDAFLRETLDKFAVAYRGNRAAIFADLNEKELIAEIAAAKDESLGHLEELFARFSAEASRRGVIVHRAADAKEANRIICDIAAKNGCRKIIKSKSMTAEEIHLNLALEEEGCEVVETDLGEWIIQLRHEGPTHMVMPAIHLSRHQVADTFSEATGQKQDDAIVKLVKVARKELRAKFIEADMGISGANFAIAENGAVGICTNEGNGRLTTTLPRVHVALCGFDKLVPTIKDALRIIKVLPRNATAQAITSYVTWISGQVDCAANADSKKIIHIVFLDNGRLKLAGDPVCGQALRCVRCGACANVCPVYRLVGGHKMGYVYIGAIGLILTYFFHGHDKAKNLVQNCINCEACKNVCAAGIDLPTVIQEIRARLNEEEGAPLSSSLLSMVLKNRRLFHSLLRFGKWAQKPITGDSRFVRHLPDIFAAGQGFRALPAISDTPFRDEWEKLAPKVSSGTIKVGLFAGCAQDFIYPEQLKSAVEIMAAKGCRVSFPDEQSCCGLPVQMMGERKSAVQTARQNIDAFAGCDCDYIVTLCASCASHMKHKYQALMGGEAGYDTKVKEFCGKIIDFSSFAVNILKLTSRDFTNDGESVCYHAPCHLCRGLDVTEEPRELMRAAANYIPTPEEDVCCGFGGTYSVKFPEISSQLMEKKLKGLEDSKAAILLSDCPGCIMQLRGGEEKRGRKLKVEHMAEFLARKLV